MRIFSKEELAQYNGKGGSKAYIACKGKVYDVSGSFLWQGGAHQVLHSAGKDLTDFIAEAPHDPELLDRFPVVGKMKES